MNEKLGRLALWMLVRALPHVPDRLVNAYLVRKTRDIAAPSAGEFLGKLFTELKHQLHRINPLCARRLLENLATPSLLAGETRRKVQAEIGTHPDVMVLSPTMRCNLACTGCYSAHYDRHDDLSTRDLDNIVDQARGIGIHFVVVSGGEPYLRDDLLGAFERHPDVLFMTYTNGIIISDRKLAPKLARLGNVIPCVSIEGFEKETEERRGRGVWQKILSTMSALKDEGVIFGFSGTPTRYNSDLLVSDELVDFYVERGCMIGWLFSYMPVGRNPDVDLMPTPEQRLRRLRRVRELRRTKPIIVADFWCDGQMTDGCLSSGKVYFHVNAQGGIEPCVFNQFSVHNIKQTPLRVALASPYFGYLRQRLGEIHNKYRPCPVTDRPQILRDACRLYQPRPSQAGGDHVISDLAPAIDAYAWQLKRVMDPEWQHDVPNGAVDDDRAHLGASPRMCPDREYAVEHPGQTWKF